MAKYSYELKKEVIRAYLNGEGGQSYLMKKYGISAKKKNPRMVSAPSDTNAEYIKQLEEEV